MLIVIDNFVIMTLFLTGCDQKHRTSQTDP